MIHISKEAANHISYLKSKEANTDSSVLRISIKEGGCSGFSYKLDFDSKDMPTDKRFTSKGIPIVIEGKSLLYIMGMTLNYEGGLNGKGFIFSNPNAKQTCGCGVSFGI